MNNGNLNQIIVMHVNFCDFIFIIFYYYYCYCLFLRKKNVVIFSRNKNMFDYMNNITYVSKVIKKKDETK